MRYVVSSGKTEHVVELGPPGDGPRALTLDGVKHVVEARSLTNGTVSLILDGRSYDVDCERPAATAGDELDAHVNVRVRGAVFALEVMEERKRALRAASARGARQDGPAALTSPMPGKVVKLHKRVGDAVEAGEGVVVVEAMKMENEIKATRAGTVKEVRVQEGQAVESGAVLLVVG